MQFDSYNFRPIRFQGVTFPSTLMGIDILESVLGITDDDLGDWLWCLPNCRGVVKYAAAGRCAKCAKQAASLILAQRQRVLDGIRDRLAEHGFEPEATYRDWLVALHRIVELSTSSGRDCAWSAPSHPNDPIDHFFRAAT
jgi:hypothetical protein